MAEAKRRKVMGKWQRRLLLAGVLILGLILGVGAGFGVQYLWKQYTKSTSSQQASTAPAAEEESSPTGEASSSTAVEPEATAPPATAPMPAPGPVAPTPAQAMNEYLKAMGIDSNSMYYAVVSASKTDPGWKIDKGSKSNSQVMYFLLHKVDGGWSVIAYAPELTAADLQVYGAPLDLLPQQ